MLRVDLRALAHGPVETTASLPPDDPLVRAAGFALTQPVEVRGRLSSVGPGQYYWSAQLTTRVASSCRRCLQDVTVQVEAPLEALFTEDATSADASARIIPARATTLDLREAIREELILAVPEFVLCQDGCRGLCPRCGKELNTGPCSCVPERDARWVALESLRTALPPDER